nr:hypothetical protein [uncultured Rothia sp.]
MAEDMPQDSSRPQDTSQDSGVSSKGQLSYQTGENTATQNNQKPQAVTKQNSQSNKKYDLGVLFVHGIGDQMPGDTLNVIYPKIKDELMVDGSLRYNDTQQASKTLAIDATIYNQHDGSNKNIAFRESHWNGLSNKVGIKNYMSNGSFSIGTLKACKYILISLLAACISHAKGLFAFISLVFIMRLMVRENVPQAVSFTVVSVLALVVIPACIAWINKVEIKKINLRAVFAWIGNCLSKARSLFSKNYWYNLWDNLKFFITSLMWLYQQIDGISGNGSNGMKVQNPTLTVRNDIQNLVNECDAVTVVAHSMGAYLSVDALQKVQGIDKGKLHLITFGSGFAPVSLLREVGQDSCRTTIFILKNILGLFSLVGSVYCSMYTVLRLINGDFSSAMPYVVWGAVCGLIYCAIYCVIYLNVRKEIAKSQTVDIKNKVTWQNHSFTADLVGSSISSLGPESDSYTIPVYKVAHKIDSYFKKGSLMCKIVSSNILEMIGVYHSGDNKYVGNFKTFRILYVVFATVFYVFMVMVDLKFADRWLGHLILFTPFVVSSIFLLYPVNDSVFSYSPYLYWDKKSGVKLDAKKIYLWSLLFGSFTGIVGFMFLYSLSVLII